MGYEQEKKNSNDSGYDYPSQNNTNLLDEESIPMDNINLKFNMNIVYEPKKEQINIGEIGFYHCRSEFDQLKF